MKNINPATLLMSISAALTLGMCIVGCFGIRALDQGALMQAKQLNKSAYNNLDGGAARALVRGSYCSIDGVLRRNNIDGGVDDGGIVCDP